VRNVESAVQVHGHLIGWGRLCGAQNGPRQR
jgi:hypothetical protein